MPISDKTRKLLWGSAGNRCAICKRELVVKPTDKDDASIIGEECHINSGKSNGPRYNSNYPLEEIDSFANLLLLCNIDHKMVDDQYETYTTDVLRLLKKDHERWVKEKLSDSSATIKIKRVKENIHSVIPRITAGNHLLNIIENAFAYSFENDELNTEEEVSLIGDFFQDLGDWGDIGSELGPRDKVKIGFELTTQIKILEEQGFLVFGCRENQVIEGGKSNPANWPVAIIKVLRKDNVAIVQGDLSNEN